MKALCDGVFYRNPRAWEMLLYVAARSLVSVVFLPVQRQTHLLLLLLLSSFVCVCVCVNRRYKGEAVHKRERERERERERTLYESF